jgi:hypothetical protein
VRGRVAGAKGFKREMVWKEVGRGCVGSSLPTYEVRSAGERDPPGEPVPRIRAQTDDGELILGAAHESRSAVAERRGLCAPARRGTRRDADGDHGELLARRAIASCVVAGGNSREAARSQASAAATQAVAKARTATSGKTQPLAPT